MALSCENMSMLLYIQFLALSEGNLQKVGEAPCHVRVSKCCVLNLHLLCEIGAIHISFYFSLEEYEEALKVNVTFFNIFIILQLKLVYLKNDIIWPRKTE